MKNDKEFERLAGAAAEEAEESYRLRLRARTPEQRKADARAMADALDPASPGAIDALRDIVAEMAAEIDDLHVANRHLAGRLDKVERESLANAELQARTADLLATFIDKVTEAVPSVGTPTIQEQCAAVEWRPPTKEDEG